MFIIFVIVLILILVILFNFIEDVIFLVNLKSIWLFLFFFLRCFVNWVLFIVSLILFDIVLISLKFDLLKLEDFLFFKIRILSIFLYIFIGMVIWVFVLLI